MRLERWSILVDLVIINHDVERQRLVLDAKELPNDFVCFHLELFSEGLRCLEIKADRIRQVEICKLVYNLKQFL